MRIAVTGAKGKLAKELLKLKWPGHEMFPWTRDDADLSQWQPTHDVFARDLPQLVIHTAASTDLAKCEADKQFGWENVALPAIHVARACCETGSRLVHVSTDAVFSGEEPIHPIPVDMRPDPINYYGLAKLAAESAARVVPDHLVVRTTMKARGPWKHAQAPTDMWISHSYVDEVAAYIHRSAASNKRGVVHYGARHVNVFEFAREGRPDVKPVLRSDIKTLRQPRDLRLEVSE